jgi:hypothetical protein
MSFVLIKMDFTNNATLLLLLLQLDARDCAMCFYFKTVLTMARQFIIGDLLLLLFFFFFFFFRGGV